MDYIVHKKDTLVNEPSSYIEIQNGEFNEFKFLNYDSIYFDIEVFNFFSPFITSQIPEFEHGGLYGITNITLYEWNKIYMMLNDFIIILLENNFETNFNDFISKYYYSCFSILDSKIKNEPKYRFEFVNFLYHFFSWVNINFTKFDSFTILGV